jgi:23S rRNA (cytidine1920-2'-O)/16S rRNA (cytidine1409-2'-O)-methyltransferase
VDSLKERLDLILVQRGLYPTREKAKTAIMAGHIYVNKQISDKPGSPVDESAEIEIRHLGCPYVGRGGLKLKQAIEVFDLDLTGVVAADFGASTGGFTDCMLQEGAKRVYAIDVGYGQLDYRLRNDDRVINRERCNIRYMEPDAIPEPLDFITVDVSFISLSLILPVVASVLRDGGNVVCLVKPQFEAGRELVGKHGLVKDPDVHIDVIRKVMSYGGDAGLRPVALSYSPITGAKGNIEYLLLLHKESKDEAVEIPVDVVVAEAHSRLDRRG